MLAGKVGLMVVVVWGVQQLMGNPSSSLEEPVCTFLHSPTRGSLCSAISNKVADSSMSDKEEEEVTLPRVS